MANNNYSFLTVLLIALVVAVIASVVTATLTGNVIKVQEKRKGTEVYTINETYSKAEIDAKLRSMDMKFSDSNNVAVAINERIYTVAVKNNSINSLVASCKDLNDIPLSGYCKTVENNAIANHGTLIYKDSFNKGGFACSNVGSLRSDMKTTVYCIDLE